MDFLDMVHSYEKKIDELSSELEQNPESWKDYQNEVNRILNAVFALCKRFEKNNQDEPERVDKLKGLFEKNFRHYFKLGKFQRQVIEKPYGYHGDFKIIDDIYANATDTLGLERCLDNYFLETGASVATRNRKEDFKRYISEYIQTATSSVRVMDLASGPCRDIKELVDTMKLSDHQTVEFDCVDHDENAIEYAKKVMGATPEKIKVNFLKKNALRIALAKDVKKLFPEKYDIIFSTGLFDYLEERVALPLIRNLRNLLKPEGLLIISNYCDKWANPSRYYMDWGGGWELVYRTEEEFRELFLGAGFKKEDLSLQYERQRIMQYQFARR